MVKKTPIVKNKKLNVLLILIKGILLIGTIFTSIPLFILKSIAALGTAIVYIPHFIIHGIKKIISVITLLFKKSTAAGYKSVLFVTRKITSAITVAFSTTQKILKRSRLAFITLQKRFKKNITTAVVTVQKKSVALYNEVISFFVTIKKTVQKKYLHFIKATKKQQKKIAKKMQLPRVKKPVIIFPTIAFPHIKLPALPRIHVPSFSFPHFSISRKQIIIAVSVVVVFVGVSSATYGTVSFLNTVPDPKSLSDFTLPASTLIYDRNGILLYDSYNETNRIPISIKEIPQTLKDAVVAAEDRRFYSHWGVDVIAIVRSVVNNLTHRKIQGGSTITQQLAKNMFLTTEKSLPRKIKEAVIAMRIEHNFSKEQILELYFNTVSFGGDTQGIEAASQKYFNKKTKDLNAKESVFLASLPVGASFLLADSNQTTNSTYEKRMQYVVDQMLKAHTLTQNQAKDIMKTPVETAPAITYKRAPHAVDYVLNEIAQKIDDDTFIKNGLVIHTSIDLPLQNYVQQQVLKTITSYQGNNINNAAVVVADPKTGEVLAMVGSANYYDDDGGQYNVAVAPRQMGSAVKVLTYAYALETQKFKPDSIIADVPTKFKEYPDYAPKNYDSKFHGNVTLKAAFANSYNIPALKVAYQVGVDNVARLGYNMGINEYKNLSDYPLSMTLGSKEMSLLHLTQVYSAVANDGVLVSLDPIDSITTYQGEVLYQKDENGKRVLSSHTAQDIYNILSDNNARIPAFGRSPQFDFGSNKIGIKTGTSNNDVDNTAFAFAPHLVVGTWMGNNDNTPMYNIASGWLGASSIMHDVTAKVLENTHNDTISSNLEVNNIGGR